MLLYITAAYFHDFIIIIVKHMKCKEKSIKKMGKKRKTFFLNTYFNNNNHLLTRETTNRNGNGGKTLEKNTTTEHEMKKCMFVWLYTTSNRNSNNNHSSTHQNRIQHESNIPVHAAHNICMIWYILLKSQHKYVFSPFFLEEVWGGRIKSDKGWHCSAFSWKDALAFQILHAS